MSLVSPLFDASAAGSLANATLCAPAPNEKAPREAEDDHAEAKRPDCAALAAPCRTGWQRWVDVMLRPISGPTHPRSFVGHN